MKIESLFPKDFITKTEQRKELESFYRFVKKCKKCKKDYGTDSNNPLMITCPECDIKKRNNK